MVCNTCKAAGTILRTAPEVAEQLHKLCPELKRQERIRSEEQHGLDAQRLNAIDRAAGKLCDCQHDTDESALNQALLTATKEPGILVP